RQRHVFQPAGSQVARGALSADGKQAAVGGAEGAARVYDTTTGKMTLELQAPKGASALAFSPDGKTLALADTDAAVSPVRLFDAATGKELAVLEGHTSAVYGLMFSSDGKRLASAGQDGTLRVWDVAAKKTLWRATVGGTVSQVAFSAD